MACNRYLCRASFLALTSTFDHGLLALPSSRYEFDTWLPHSYLHIWEALKLFETCIRLANENGGIVLP